MKGLLLRIGLYQPLVRLYAAWVLLKVAAIRIRTGRKLLVLIRAGGLGDIIATLPSVEALREEFPQRTIVYCTRAEFCELPAMVPQIDLIIAVKHADTVARVLAQFFDARSFVYDDEIPGRGSRRHFVDEMATSVQAKISSRDPKLNLPALSEIEFKRLTGIRRPHGILVAIHTGPTSPVREWPIANWERLVRHLRVDCAATVLQIGTRRHFLHGTVDDDTVPGALRCSKELSSRESGTLLKSCDLFIGVDSGPFHLAAAVGTPSIGLFGPVNPSFRVPRSTTPITVEPKLACQFCHHQLPRGHWDTGCPKESACMGTLEPEDVLRAVQKIGGILASHV